MAAAGRPRSFDRDAAVDSAMRLFWEHGYEAASLEELRRAMGGGKGISSASFYAAFTSKEALYREALSRYLDVHGGMVGMLRDPRWPPRQRLERALRACVAVQTDAAHPLGCMLALSATVGPASGAGVLSLTAAGRGVTREALRDCLQAGVDTGDLAADTDLEGLTALYDGFLLGVAIQARDGVPRTAIDAGLTCALAAWDANASKKPAQS